jgi:hypothetical protein
MKRLLNGKKKDTSTLVWWTTQRIPQVPANAEQNDVGLEMTPFERILLDHDEELLYSAPNKEEFIITHSFLQHNPLKLVPIDKYLVPSLLFSQVSYTGMASSSFPFR